MDFTDSQSMLSAVLETSQSFAIFKSNSTSSSLQTNSFYFSFFFGGIIFYTLHVASRELKTHVRLHVNGDENGNICLRIVQTVSV